MEQVEERYISLLTDKNLYKLSQYEASKKAYRDIKNSVDTAKREGIAEGMEKGMKQGMEQRSLEIARKMLAKGMDAASVMEITGLSAEQMQQLKAEF
jgi:predicted transposase/invertase (TIGR01784 family)